MYESFFGLREPAFSLAPDPRFLWPSDTHDEGLAALIYGITRRKGFMLITGEVGTGKTTLLRAALDRIPEDTEVALVLNTSGLRPVDLLKLIATEYRLPGPFDGKVDYVIALNRFLMQQLEAGTNTVLIIDEAQNLGTELLEEVRLLSNLETDTEKLLQIVLVGQPELRQKLATQNLRQLRQRVAIEHHIQPLAPDEVRRYLAHRIDVAGGKYDEVFAPGADAAFYAFSAGCPRLISLLADRVLLAAFSKQVKPVPQAMVEKKAKEMAESRLDSTLPGAGGQHG
ncbi:MAG: AAA family ATPase [Deltaproteobacteria bacterium]|nr:AAA family ATPase [Deltaproteobacteria bacterium]MBW2395523.1 AAA family ATPase [Deltaproteobacteria bacterium]